MILKITASLFSLAISGFGLYIAITNNGDNNKFATGSLLLFIGGLATIICSNDWNRKKH